MKIAYSSNIALIDNLTESLKNGNMGDDERAQACAMKKSLIDKFIEEHHHNKISPYTTRKGGKEYTTYTTRVKGMKNKMSAQSEDLLKEKLYEHYSGKSNKDTATFASIFKDALNWHSAENANSQKTRTRNEKLYNARIKGTDFEKMPIKEIGTHAIKTFLKSFTNIVRKRELGNIKTLLNFTFEYACEELEIIPYNVAASVSTNGIKCLSEKSVGSLAYTKEEATRIVGHIIASTNVYYEAICFAFYVGRRFNEISDLKWSDLVDDRILVISHGNTESGNLKNGSESVNRLYLCDEAYSLLRRYKAERPDSEWIFPNKAGNRIFNNRLNENLKKICDELGIRYRSSHKIRAYAITQVSSAGNIESTREFAGHTDYRMTQRYINNAITEANKKATEALNLGIQTISDHSCSKEKTS